MIIFRYKWLYYVIDANLYKADIYGSKRCSSLIEFQREDEIIGLCFHVPKLKIWIFKFFYNKTWKKTNRRI